MSTTTGRPLVVLVGPMGAGKTTVGALLAQRLGVGLRDSDEDIVASTGREIGEIFVDDGDIELNAGRATLTLTVTNSGDRPIQVGSHYHFHETNAALAFDREEARGFRLDIPAGTAVRFEPGQSRDVKLIPLSGSRTVYGFRQDVMGRL